MVNKKIHTKNIRGFTLIELLVVISIIGVLTTIVFAALNSAREKAKVARAKTEAIEIIKAAELVFHDYGYYPNDSHGTVTCPKDIIVDQVTSKTFGSYINICNDPWGYPYEWNNQCAGGATTRKPHAPFDPSCPSFSESSSGPIGITVVGADGVNNNCTGDDLCSGQRGHMEYGFSGPAVPSEGGGGQMCTESVADCSSLSSVQCVFRDGCTLDAGGCTGSYGGSCGGFTDQSSCTALPECSWSAGSCGGTATTCNTYGDSSSCGGAPGCGWSQSCGGTVSCSTYNSNQTSCTSAGCSYAAASCGGSYACSQWNGTNSSTCTTGHSGCTWTSSGGGKCNGGSQSCSSFSQSSCTPTGCSWGSSSCSGSPSCSSISYAQCSTYAGCSPSQACSGSPNSCTSYGGSSSCSTASGCSWSASNCSGSYSGNCTTLTEQTSCQAEGTCTWTSQTCTGTALSCGDNSTENSCNAQSGCSWQ